MTTKVFIDGKAGTTGLRIYERLQIRNDIQLMTLSEEDRICEIARLLGGDHITDITLQSAQELIQNAIC